VLPARRRADRRSEKIGTGYQQRNEGRGVGFRGRSSSQCVSTEICPYIVATDNLGSHRRFRDRRTSGNCVFRGTFSSPAFTQCGVSQSLVYSSTSGVASTDMERVNIMITRVVEQLGAIPQLKSNATLRVSAKPVAVPESASETLEQQVQSVALRVTEMIKQDLSKRGLTGKEN
jgi:hypothetical protein